jgi:hypothetical protein
LARLLVFTVILFYALMAIQDGQGAPPIMQLKVGTIPQLFESVNWTAPVAVNV